MSEPKEKVDISDLKDAFLECPVCVEHFNQTDRRPRLLHSCLHAFCTQCLQQLIQKEGKGQITCPLCRQIQTVTDDVKSLPMDPVRDQLVEYLQITHKQKLLCKDCPDENRAKSRCLECGENLCQDCEYVHRRHRSSRSHRVVPLEELEKESCGTLKTRHFCTIHSDRVVECFCENCEVLCCLLCAVIDHKGHDFKKLDDAAKMKIEEIESSMTVVEKVFDKLITAKSDYEAYLKDIQNDKGNLLLEINMKFDTAEQLLRERRVFILKEVEQSSERLEAGAKKNASIYDDTLSQIKATQTYFANAKTDEVSMLQTYPSLKKTISNLTQNYSGLIEKCTGKVDFDAVDETNMQKYITGFGAVRTIKTDEGRNEDMSEDWRSQSFRDTSKCSQSVPLAKGYSEYMLEDWISQSSTCSDSVLVAEVYKEDVSEGWRRQSFRDTSKCSQSVPLAKDYGEQPAAAMMCTSCFRSLTICKCGQRTPIRHTHKKRKRKRKEKSY